MAFDFPTHTYNGVTVLDNFFLTTVVQDYRNTALDMMQYGLVNRDLEAEDGDIKKILTRHIAPVAEVVAEGAGNTQHTGMTITSDEYKVNTVQEQVFYTDEQLRKDSEGIYALVQSLGTGIVNKKNLEVLALLLGVGEDMTVTSAGNFYDDFIDSQALIDYSIITDVSQAGEGTDLSAKAATTFALLGRKALAAVRKKCREDLSKTEHYIRNGYVGTVANTELHYSKLMDTEDNADKIIVATPLAVTTFLKNELEVEQVVKNARGNDEANKRLNYIYARQVGVTAMTDATKATVIDISAALPTGGSDDDSSEG